MIFSHIHSLHICVAALILYSQLVHARVISTSADPRETMLNKPTKTIDFSLALLIEASLAANLRQPIMLLQFPSPMIPIIFLNITLSAVWL